jgi:hypothetical protein
MRKTIYDFAPARRASRFALVAALLLLLAVAASYQPPGTFASLPQGNDVRVSRTVKGNTETWRMDESYVKKPIIEFQQIRLQPGEGHGQTWNLYVSPDPSILVAAQAPANNTFYVRSYGGKCLAYGAPRTLIETTVARSYPVFISDCNRTAVQQIRVEELTDRPGHLVILRAGSGVIGKKLNPVLTTRASSAALSFSSTADQTPLEVQPYTGSAGQIFALDGDSMILASDRNLVVEVQNNRGKNQTPLVLGRRDLADSEFWTFTATDGSAKRPTSGFVRVPQERDHRPLVHQLVSAVTAAQPGTVIEIDQDTGIDLTEQVSLSLPEGVTIRGDRRGTNPGPELSTSNKYAEYGMLDIAGNDVRITGLRLRGPSRDTDGDDREAVGINAHDNLFTRTIIDHNDMSAWTHAAVLVRGDDNSEDCNPRDHRDPRSRPENVFVARNFIHHNERQNNGYGVSTYTGGYARIEGNTFVSNRHAVTGEDGRARTSFRAWYNLVLEDGPLQHKLGYSWHTQDFDMHGTGKPTFGDHRGGTGGQYMEIAGNTFLGTNRENFDLRGTPCFMAEFHHNISRQSLGDALHNDGDSSKLRVYDTNQFNAPDPTNRLGVGDFDGDGKDDLFLATGAAWYYSSAGKAEWRFLNAQTDGIGTLLFGDFDGDGRTDVFTQHGGNKWDVSWGGASRWETINGSGPILGNAAIGDFDGDHRADVFYANGQEWFVSYGGVGPFTHLALAIHRIPDLRFGDFNADGKTDVFGVVGADWAVVYGGTQYWAPLRPKLSDDIAELTVADFDGDRRADVARLHRAHGPKTSAFIWLISLRGTADWTKPLVAMPMTKAAFGRFDSNPGVDVLLWGGDEHLYISSWGRGASVQQSRQDMR